MIRRSGGRSSPAFAFAILTALLVPLLLSCARKGSEGGGTTPAEGSGAHPPMAVVAVPGEPDQLLPPLARSPASTALWTWIFPSLVRIEADSLMRGRFVGDLAASWQIDDDRRGIRFHLDTTRLWDDTTAVGVADVLTSYRLYRDPTIAGSWARRLDEIVSVEEPQSSPGTILFRFRRPLALARALQLASLPVISSAQWAQNVNRRPALGEPGRLPHAAGPFRVEEWKPGDSIRLARHPFPPAERVPRAERVLVRFAPGGRSRSIQVEQGIADVAIDIPPEEAQRLREEAAGGVRLARGGAVEVEALVWNCDHPMWGRWDLRRDVAAHLDATRLRRAASGPTEDARDLEATGLFEARVPPPNPASPDSATDSIPSFSFGIYGNPTLEILYDTANPRRERIAVEIAVQLDRFGMPVRLTPAPGAECLARIDQRRFDAVVAGFAIPAIHDVGEVWGAGGILNVSGLRAAGVDSLIAVARSAAADTIPDAWDRVELSAHTQFPFIPIDRRVRIDAIGPAARGYHADPFDAYGDLLSLEHESNKGIDSGRANRR